MIRRGYADTPEGQVHYLTAGEGEPLVLLHQSPRSSRMYLRLIPLLATHYRVIAPDMLGYGYSDPPPPSGDTILHLGRNVVHVMDALKIKRCHLFGLHTGAVVAAEAAAGWPERIGTLILFAYTLIENEQERQAILENRKGGIPTWIPSADGAHVVKIWMRAYGDILRLLLHTSRPPSEEFYLSPDTITSSTFHPTPSRAPHRFVTPEHIRFMEQWVLDYMKTKDSIPPIYESIYTRDSKAPLLRIQAPTLHIEPDTPYEVFFNVRGRRVAELIPHCQLATLPDSDDNAAEFNPSGLAAMMLDYLQKHSL